MEWLRHEGLNNLHDKMERQSDGITVLDGPRDVVGLAAFLSMEVKMPIASLLRGNSALWQDLSDWMNGHLDSMAEVHDEKWTKEESNLENDMPMVPINKLGQYLSIMTKHCWEKWERPPMEKTLLIVKLADGTTTRPIGVVNDLKIRTFDITYHVWFVVMDFKNPIDSYDIILGRPFLSLAKIVHDWS